MMHVHSQWLIGQKGFYNGGGGKKEKNVKEHDKNIFVERQALGLYLLTIVSVASILVPGSYEMLNKNVWNE